MAARNVDSKTASILLALLSAFSTGSCATGSAPPFSATASTVRLELDDQIESLDQRSLVVKYRVHNVSAHSVTLSQYPGIILEHTCKGSDGLYHGLVSGPFFLPPAPAEFARMLLSVPAGASLHGEKHLVIAPDCASDVRVTGRFSSMGPALPL